jgi:transcriptional regulator with XRE-family HTH domain
MPELKNIFKERLKQVRASKSFSLDELGAKVSVTRQAIIKYEAGKAYPSFWVLCDLADALDVSLDYLVGRSDNPKRR